MRLASRDCSWGCQYKCSTILNLSLHLKILADEVLAFAEDDVGAAFFVPFSPAVPDNMRLGPSQSAF